MDNVLITCASYNEGSRKTIESLGGTFEMKNIDEITGELMELYWINMNDSLERNKVNYEKYVKSK